MQIQSRLPNTGTSIFAIMTALANENKAVNLAQGFPDYPIDPDLIEIVHRKMKLGFNQYAPMPGYMPLREAIASKIGLNYRAELNPDENITIVAGATQGLFVTIMALVQPGDEVIIFEPAYDSYVPSIKVAGGVVVPYTLKGPDFKIDWDEFSSLITPKTKLVIVNTPHNPCGTIFSSDDWDTLYDRISHKDIFILSDEVYEHMVFDDQKHESVLQKPWWKERALAVYSFGKTLHATGWKLGYVVANMEITKEIRKVHQFNIFSCNTPIQAAIAEYLPNNEVFNNLPSFFQQKRDFLNKALIDSRFEILTSKGTYFTLLDYSRISNLEDMEFVKLLVKEYGIAVIPLSVFHSKPPNEKYVRLCFAKEENTLLAAADRLKSI